MVIPLYNHNKALELYIHGSFNTAHEGGSSCAGVWETDDTLTTIIPNIPLSKLGIRSKSQHYAQAEFQWNQFNLDYNTYVKSPHLRFRVIAKPKH
jgi:hypothetical protein